MEFIVVVGCLTMPMLNIWDLLHRTQLTFTWICWIHMNMRLDIFRSLQVDKDMLPPRHSQKESLLLPNGMRTKMWFLLHCICYQMHGKRNIMFPSGEYKTFILYVIKGNYQGTSSFLPFHMGHYCTKCMIYHVWETLQA